MIPLYLADFGLVAAIVGIVISLSAATYSGISAYRQKKKARRFQRPEEDTRRSNVASQGAFIPVVIGRQRVGCLIGWIGDRWAKPGRRSKNTAILYQEAA